MPKSLAARASLSNHFVETASIASPCRRRAGANSRRRRPLGVRLIIDDSLFERTVRRLAPQASYAIVDPPETLKLSGCYLATRQSAPVLLAPPSVVSPKEPCILLCLATAIDRMEGLPINLAINSVSFGEMSTARVGRSAAFLRRNLAPGACSLRISTTRVSRAQISAIRRRHWRCTSSINRRLRVCISRAGRESGRPSC